MSTFSDLSTEEYEQKMYEKILADSIKITNIEDDEIQRAIDASMEQERLEKEEMERIIQESIKSAKDEEDKRDEEIAKKKRKRPTRNVNKIIMFDLSEIKETKEIELFINNKKHNIKIETDLADDNIQHWIVTFHTGPELWGTMQWDLKFTEQYPAKPPKIRVIKPYFKPYTGHITYGGAICNPLLVTGQGWNPETEMLPLFIALINGMIDTDSPAKLKDENDEVVEYSERQAEAARQRYYKNHGWKY